MADCIGIGIDPYSGKMKEEKMSERFVTEPSGESKEFIRQHLPGEELYSSFMEKMTVLQAFLYETNEKFNLTALGPETFWSKHVADSLSLVKAIPEIASLPYKLLDLGCGAGFPSLVLAAAFPALQITSVDSTGKKIAYVNDAAGKLGLKNLLGVHARGNELARKEPYAKAYDIVTARAVSDVETLLKEGSGFLKGEGRGVLAIYRTSSQLEGEKDFLNRNRKVNWTSTELFSLPEEAGMRQFLLVRKKGK